MITVDARWLSASGMGTYLRNLIPGIVAAFPAQRFTLLGNIEEIQTLGILDTGNIVVVPATSSMYSLAEQFEIPRKIPKGTRLYFAPHYNIPLLYRGKMLVTIYDLFHLAMPRLVGGLHKTVYAQFMFNAVRRRSASIITISHFTKQELIRFTGVGPQPIFPVHLGVDKSWFELPETIAPHPRPYLLYVGNIKPHKNLGALITAFGSIAGGIAHDLVLVGKKEGFITGDKQSVLEAKRLQGRVHFTGKVTESILKQYMAHADAMVFPSLYEGFGLPPLEAMAAGCPVVASSAASLPEICGEAALYCDPYSASDIAQKLAMLLSDDALRATLRRKGRERASQFTWEKCVKETCQVIDGLLPL